MDIAVFNNILGQTVLIVRVKLRKVVTPPHRKQSDTECKSQDKKQKRDLQQIGVCQFYAKSTDVFKSACDIFTRENLADSTHEVVLPIAS
jgi:hypothetical protein